MKSLSTHITESFITESKKDVTSNYSKEELELLKLVDNGSRFASYLPKVYIDQKKKSITVYMHDMLQDWKVGDKLEKNTKIQELAKSLGYSIDVDKTAGGDYYDSNKETVVQDK